MTIVESKKDIADSRFPAPKFINDKRWLINDFEVQSFIVNN